MKMPRVLLADDHSIMVEGLRKILEPNVELVGTCEDGRALLVAATKLRPDIVIVDVSMPLLNGVDATRELKKDHPRLKVIVLTMHANVKYAEAAFRAGADGYVIKKSAANELLAAIREVQQGRAYLTPLVTKDVLNFLVDRAPSSRRSEDLTDRQRGVLQLIAEGHTIKGIARELRISPKTAESHRYAIMKELDLHTTAELTKYAIQQGIVPLE